MYLIQNQNKETTAYIQNMMILDVQQEKVIGILIGDWVRYLIKLLIYLMVKLLVK